MLLTTKTTTQRYVIQCGKKSGCPKYQPIKKLEDKNTTIEGRNMDMANL